jgi:hypothetical protein
MWWVVGVVTAVVLLATYVTWTAGRVDRLHARAAGALAALDAALVRRAAAAVELGERVGDAELPAIARAALAAPAPERELAENDVTRALRAATATIAADGPDALASLDGHLDAVVASSRRVALARQVHNDLVRDARAVRRLTLVRVLRFARGHAEPRFFDIDEPTLDDAKQFGNHAE